jgi:DNA polymerase-3 subunit alpha
MADFEKRVAGRSCHAGQRDALDRVGAFSRIEAGQQPADHPDRRRAQLELMAGLIADAVIVDREPDLSPLALQALNETINGWKACKRCELGGLCHPKPRVVKQVKAVAILDGPGYREEAMDEMGHGGHAEALNQALDKIGLTIDDLYITSLVKSPKPGKGSKWSPKTLGECAAWLDEELRILKPPVAIILGSETFWRFFKGMKGGINEHAGRVIYDKERDLNWLIGINPNAIHFDPGKQDVLDAAIAKLGDLLPA